MINSFFGLELGKRALDYFRRGMETAGHNISNADVEGYSRQRVEASTTDPYTDPGLARPAIPGQIGTGVKIDAIVRLRDEFLDVQYREESTVQGYWDAISSALDTVELYINEPGGKGLKASLDSFWTSLEDFHTQADSASVREVVVSQVKSLTAELDQIVQNYDEYRKALDRDLVLQVDQANDYIDQIAALNVTIKEIEGVGGNPNDLYDRRDLLAEKLSKLIDIDVNPACSISNEYIIDLHGKILVQGDQTRHLVAVEVAGNNGMHDVQVEENEFDLVGKPEVLEIIAEQGAQDAVHNIAIDRLASETTWKVGQGDATLPACPPRVRPTSVSEALSLKGSITLQVGSQGVQSKSKVLSAPLLTAGTAGDAYSFRVSAGTEERDVSVTWNGANWEISDDAGTAVFTTAADTLSVADIQGFLSTSLGSMDVSATLTTAATGDQMTLASDDFHMISIVDVKGSIVSKLGMTDDSPKMSIDVTEADTLETIRNKINGVYGITDENGDAILDKPEQWLHASIEKGTDDTFYLVLESNVVGESQRINVIGDESGSMHVAQRLGLVSTETVGGVSRTETSFMQQAEDASFTFDDHRYLSSSNMFREARLVPAKNEITKAYDDYTATRTSEVSEGITLKLKKASDETSITIRHHVQGGSIAGTMEARDDYILSYLDAFDELAYTLATEMNAIHYGGHGIGDNETTTGVNFFETIAAQYGASRTLDLNAAVVNDPSLIGAARDDGKGMSLGCGDGSNALLMAQQKQARVMTSDSATFNQFYEAFTARLGSDAGRAEQMTENQTELTGQIDTQRQSTMGVNIDEEMLDIVKFQQSFNAMSRYITTIDEMLDKIINGMGLVGR